MFQVITFKIKNQTYRYLWRGNQPLPKNISFSGPETITEKGQTSSFYVCENSKYLFKFLKTKQNKSFLKIIPETVANYFGSSSAAKELQGNNTLIKIGVPVPKAYGVGFPLKTNTPYRCLYVQEYLGDSISLETYLESSPQVEKQTEVLRKVFDNISCMYKNRIYLRDMHPTDVLVNNDGYIRWVDTRAKKFKSERTFNKIFTKRLEVFIAVLKRYGVREEDLPPNALYNLK